MAKIRISSKDKSEYNKLKNRVKSKINRTLKNYGVNLINEISIPDLSDFQTRKEYNDWKKKASSFTNRANQHYQFKKNDFGVVVSKAELAQTKREYDRAVRLAKDRQKKIENLDLKFQGKVIGKVKQREVLFSHPETVDMPEPFNFDKIRDRKHFERRREQYKKRASGNYFKEADDRMKDNFIRSVEGSFGSTEFVEEVIEKLRALPSDIFYELYKQNFNEFDFALYDSDGQFASANLSHLVAIEHIIDEYERGDNDLLLKDFPDRV